MKKIREHKGIVIYMKDVNGKEIPIYTITEFEFSGHEIYGVIHLH